MKGLQGRDWSFCVPPDSSQWSPVRKFPWAMMSGRFIGVSSCRQNWLWASSSALLSPEVGLTQSSNPLTTVRLGFLETSPALKLSGAHYVHPTCPYPLPPSPPLHSTPTWLPRASLYVSAQWLSLSPEVALFPKQQAGSSWIHSAWRYPHRQRGKAICRDFTHWVNRGLRIGTQRVRICCALPNLLHWLLGLINPGQQPVSHAARRDRDRKWRQPPRMSILLC